MKSGKLRHFISIETATTVDSSTGAPEDTWVAFATARAQIIPVNGREYFSASQERASVTHKIKMRYLPGITEEMRIKFDDRIFEIESIINFQEKNKELEIMATENV